MLQGNTMRPPASYVALAVSGRNLLCQIARGSDLSVARNSALETCTAVAQLFSGIDSSLERTLLSRDTVDIDPVLASRTWDCGGQAVVASPSGALEAADASIIAPGRNPPASDALTTSQTADPVTHDGALPDEVSSVPRYDSHFLDSLEELFGHSNQVYGSLGFPFPMQ
ncbi:hypothetical protein PaG_05286 [Moesziomyces aphidis]|uniref:Uncharacterized protein n=1 Tax=Moesziomyces aphidis TaxID=84754 RepID=W3VGI4_MOEAP|nr:hypothetical protein PaG_05286 [Moesziomyces aphidis]